MQPSAPLSKEPPRFRGVLVGLTFNQNLLCNLFFWLAMYIDIDYNCNLDCIYLYYKPHCNLAVFYSLNNAKEFHVGFTFPEDTSP